ncbi:MAG: hypothetical protein DRP57_09050, partial [Spirochaetes bacterium]
LAAYYPMPVKATYAASKRFILDFSRAIREELKKDYVTITALCPGGMPSNEEVIKAIDRQGFFSRLTTTNVGYVASKTIDSALKGKALYIPGLFNVLLSMLGRMVPPGIIAMFIAMRWNHAQEHSRAKNINPSRLRAEAISQSVPSYPRTYLSKRRQKTA